MSLYQAVNSVLLVIIVHFDLQVKKASLRCPAHYDAATQYHSLATDPALVK